MNEEEKIDEALRNMGSSLEEFDEYTRMGIDKMRRGAEQVGEHVGEMMNAAAAAAFAGCNGAARAIEQRMASENEAVREKLAAAFNEGRATPAAGSDWGFERSRSGTVVQTADGQHIAVTSEEVEEALTKLRTSTAPQHPDAEELVEGLQHNGISSVTARVRGKIVYQGSVEHEDIRQALAAVMIQYRRKFHLTLRMTDGSKQRYRGNGVRLG